MTVTAFRIPPLAALLLAGGVALVWGLIWTGSAAAQGYKVRTGDTLAVEVLQDGSLNRNVLVTPDGTFTFPFAGTVRAAGRTPAQISQQITQSIASNFAAPPNVFVSVQALRPEEPRQPEEEQVMLIYVLGEVNEPGPKQLLPGATLLQALSTTGGLTNFAADKRLQLRRTDPHTGAQGVTVVNYRAIAAGAALTQDIVLAEGDVILVPQRRLFE